MRRSDMKVGLRIGRLVFIEFRESDWVFQCDCGKIYFTKGLNWMSRSCGCYKKELSAEKCRTMYPTGNQRRGWNGQFIKSREDNNE